jgi:hypothetical protein
MVPRFCLSFQPHLGPFRPSITFPWSCVPQASGFPHRARSAQASKRSSGILSNASTCWFRRLTLTRMVSSGSRLRSKSS